nr:pentatricopeptide repeat-containing protein At1g62590-like [Coffea arabica]
MQASGMKPDFHTYCVVLDGLCKTGHVDEALELFHATEADGTDLHIEMYNIMLDGLCKCRRVDSARDLFKNLSLKRLDPDVITYNTMIAGLLSEGLLIEGKELVEKMEEKGCLANSVTYNVILQGLLKGARGSWMGDKEDLHISCNMLRRSLGDILQGLFKGGHYDDGIVYHEEMVHRGFLLDASTFSILLDLSAENQNNPSVLMLMLKIDPDSKKFMDGR